jgi:hypothetical protein
MFNPMLRVSAILVFALSSFQVGCSSDDNDGPSAQDSCEMLTDAMCERLTTCAGELTGQKLSASDRDELCDNVLSEIDCNKVVAVSDDYEECSDSIASASCEDVYSVDDDGNLEVNELPPVCEGVILTK